MVSNDRIDYFNVLGVSATSSIQEIKRSFRRLAMKYHPDKNPGDKSAEEKFRLVNQAYQVLSDPEKRVAWEQSFSEEKNNSTNIKDDNFWEDVIERNQRNKKSVFDPVAGSPILLNCKLTFKEVFANPKVTKVLHFSKKCKCSTCNGSGYVVTEDLCQHCHGTGSVRTQKMSSAGYYTSEESCSYCKGTGHILQSCEVCDSGSITEKISLPVELGSEYLKHSPIVLEGEGNHGLNGGYGDLTLKFSLIPENDCEWDSEKDVIRLTSFVSFKYFILGGTCTVRSPFGDFSVEIPASFNGHRYYTCITASTCSIPIEIWLYPSFPRYEDLNEGQISLLNSFKNVEIDSAVSESHNF